MLDDTFYGVHHPTMDRRKEIAGDSQETLLQISVTMHLNQKTVIVMLLSMFSVLAFQTLTGVMQHNEQMKYRFIDSRLSPFALRASAL
jgi:hypothetical protein